MSICKLFALAGLATVALIPVSAHAQNLSTTLAYAYENSPTLASAFLSVRSAGVAIRNAEGTLLPNIGASASYSQSFTFSPDQTTIGPGGAPVVVGGNSVRTSDSIGLSYNQTLFDNFATDAAIRAAQESYQAAAFAAENAEQNVLLEAATAFYNVILDRRIVDIRSENIGFVEAQLDASQARLDLGEGTQLDVAQARASLAQATASYQAAVNNLLISEANFMRAVGIEPGALRDDVAISSLIPANVERAMIAAEEGHPALLASQAQIRAATFQAEQTINSFGPNISVNASAGTGGFTTGTVANSVTMGISLNVPIYTPTRDPAIEQANIGRMQSEVEAFATRDQIYEAVRQAWAGFNSATAQIQSATAAVAATRLALEAVVDQNEVGQSTTLDVLDARASLLTVEEQLVSAQAQRNIAAFSLVSAMGRLSAAELGLGVQPRAADGTYLAVPVTVETAPADAWDGLR